MPDNIGRLFYLDDDTLVLGDISELFMMPLEKTFGIAMDAAPHPLRNMQPDESGMTIYNCGTMLINVGRWKELKCTEKIIEIMKSPELYYHDQDIINRFFKDEIVTLPCRYNYQVWNYNFSGKAYHSAFKPIDYYSVEEIDSTAHDIGVAHFLHFCGESGWNKNTIHPYGKLFKEYFDKSPWASLVELKPSANGFDRKAEKLIYSVLPKSIFLKLWVFYQKKKGHLYLKGKKN